ERDTRADHTFSSGEPGFTWPNERLEPIAAQLPRRAVYGQRARDVKIRLRHERLGTKVPVRPLPQELLGSHSDEPDSRAARVFARIEERREELRGARVQRVRARDFPAGRVRASQRPEVREPDGDRDSPAGAEALPLESREDLACQSPNPLQDEVGVERVHLEGLLLADRFRLPVVRDDAVGEPARLGVEILAPAAEPLDELADLEPTKVADGTDVPLVQLRLGLGADPGDDADAHRIEKRLNLVGRDHRLATGLADVRGCLRHELVGAEADRAREPLAFGDLALERARALHTAF